MIDLSEVVNGILRGHLRLDRSGDCPFPQPLASHIAPTPLASHTLLRVNLAPESYTIRDDINPINFFRHPGTTM